MTISQVTAAPSTESSSEPNDESLPLLMQLHVNTPANNNELNLQPSAKMPLTNPIEGHNQESAEKSDQAKEEKTVVVPRSSDKGAAIGGSAGATLLATLLVLLTWLINKPSENSTDNKLAFGLLLAVSALTGIPFGLVFGALIGAAIQNVTTSWINNKSPASNTNPANNGMFEPEIIVTAPVQNNAQTPDFTPDIEKRLEI
jgi:hypothetical protein